MRGLITKVRIALERYQTAVQKNDIALRLQAEKRQEENDAANELIRVMEDVLGKPRNAKGH